MGLNLTAYTYVLGATAIVLGCFTVIAWKRRIHGGGTLALMAFAAFVWALAGTFEVSSADAGTRIAFAKAGYLGAAPLPLLYLMLALRYGGHRLGRWKSVLVTGLVASIATFVAVATNDLHHLFWVSIESPVVPRLGLLIFAPGPWYWAYLGYSAVLTLLGTVLLALQASRTHRLYRAQAGTVLAAVAVPWIGELISVLPWNPFPGLNLTLISLAVTGALLLVGVFRYRLGEVIPIARDAMLEEMTDAVIVLDAAGRIVDVNPAGRRMFTLAPSSIGKNVGEALPWMRDILPPNGPAGCPPPPLVLPEVPGRSFEVRVSPLRTRGDGSMIVLRDITDRAAMELERDHLIANLRTALADIRTLRGLLPICASCKKIRNDEGYWQNLEQYIVEHSQAEFSHGICPDCLARVYAQGEEGLRKEGTG